MSFAGSNIDLPTEGSGADVSDVGAGDRTGAAQLPFSTSLAETASDAFMSGVRGVADYVDLDQEAYRARLDKQFLVDPTADPGGAAIDPESWQKKYPDLGIKFTPDMGQAQAQLLVDHKQEQARREYVLDNSPNSFAAKTARGLTEFAVSAIDPLNVAAAFVPGVGEARAGLLAERFGPTVGRLFEGAAAGATGTAALQPLQYAEANAYQDQFGPMDAFLNVAFGTVLGGGLHAGVGRLSDLLQRAAPETREASLRASVAQAVEGRPVDVEPVLAADPVFYPGSPEAQSVIDAADQLTVAKSKIADAQAAVDNAGQAFETARQSLATRALTERTAVGGLDENTLARLNDLSGELGGTIPAARRKSLVRQQDLIRGSLRDSTPELADLLDAHDAAKDAATSALQDHVAAGKKLNEALSGAAKADSRFRDLAARANPVAADTAAQKAGVDLGPAARTAAKTQRLAARTALATGDTSGVPSDALAAEARDTAVQAQSQTQSAAPPAIERARQQSLDFAQGREPSRVEAAPEVRDQTTRDVATGRGDDPQAELQDAMEQLQGYKDQGVVTDADFAKFTEANAANTEAAKSWTDAAKAAARCLFLHP